ncbi:GrBNV gp36-like protein [Tomelloso virus]|uniref:GrBNV gp36-like protein n=1 Tax=Tomelloso virus TaxID=2053981 RepID=A0A2H4T2V8_9VIRU|nr:GrBNV gp36-like protein [Tomelloso virus]ATY70209.1 GrBNV gp36-like protein [Tomelloso virus]
MSDIKVNNDLSDNAAIDPQNAHEYGVIISVPIIYVSTDEEKCIDRIVSNLRVIPYDDLMDSVKIAMRIAHSNKEEQLNISSEFASRLAKSEDGEYSQFIELIKWGGSIAKELDVQEDYCEVSNVGVSFDVIRTFIVDPSTGVLQSAQPTTYQNYQLYSQLGNNEQAIQEIRQATNDTDFNRIQFYLAHFEKQLTFTPGYVPNQTTKLINLAFFFMTIFSQSRPISGYSSNDLKGNILSYSVDVLARSRVIQAWQRDQNTKMLLKDLTTNYDSRNYISKISNIPTARERANTFLNLVKKKPELAQILDADFYNRYVKLLEKYAMTIDGADYYLLGSEFIVDLGAMLPSNIMDIQKMNLNL